MARMIMASWLAVRCSYSRTVRRCLLIWAQGALHDPARACNAWVVSARVKAEAASA
jgi:hypothetical protein